MPTKIEWTDETWNPLVGCERVGPGCDHCYAIGVVHRQMSPQHVGLTVKPDGAPTDWTGELREVPHLLDKPLRWRRPRRIFVNSLSDLFHRDVTDDYIAQVFAVMALAPQHSFQVLTKRPQRMAGLLASDDFVASMCSEILARTPSKAATDAAWRWPLPNVWLGTSIETDRYAFRADHLRATPAAVRWISAEPLLGPLPTLNLEGIGWVVAGGESGPGARPMDPDWARDLRDRCATADVPFLFKQWGNWAPTGAQVLGRLARDEVYVGQPVNEWGSRMTLRRTSKAEAGRELDGRTHDGYPEQVS